MRESVDAKKIVLWQYEKPVLQEYTYFGVTVAGASPGKTTGGDINTEVCNVPGLDPA